MRLTRAFLLIGASFFALEEFQFSLHIVNYVDTVVVMAKLEISNSDPEVSFSRFGIELLRQLEPLECILVHVLGQVSNCNVKAAAKVPAVES